MDRELTDEEFEYFVENGGSPWDRSLLHDFAETAAREIRLLRQENKALVDQLEKALRAP
jgi:hypothetical protein